MTATEVTVRQSMTRVAPLDIVCLARMSQYHGHRISEVNTAMSFSVRWIPGTGQMQ